MLKKVICLLVAVGAFSLARAVDMNAIEVDARLHPAKIKQLIERFESADTTLTSQEIATAYYGYSFTGDYDPSDSFPLLQEAYDKEEYEVVEALVVEALRINPMSLDLNVMALAAADHFRDTGTHGEQIRKYGIRCDLIATAILESGKGTSAASPFYVICSSDMSRVLRNVLGIDRIVDRTRVGNVEAIKVTFPGSDRQHIIYFDNNREKDFFLQQKNKR